MRSFIRMRWKKQGTNPNRKWLALNIGTVLAIQSDTPEPSLCFLYKICLDTILQQNYRN